MLCPVCGMCRCVQEQGCSGAHRSHSKGPRCLCEAGHLLSWFCFSSSQWAPNPPCKQREFKNCNPSCVSKCSECCGELERWQLGYPALPLQQEATSPLAATTHLCNMPQRKETRINCKGHCIPTSGAGDTPSMGMGSLCKAQICSLRASSSLPSEIINTLCCCNRVAETGQFIKEKGSSGGWCISSCSHCCNKIPDRSTL